MKEPCEDESECEQQSRMQAMNALRDLTLSIPCRGLIGNISRPIAEEEVAAIKERTRKVFVGQNEKTHGTWNGNVLSVGNTK